MSKIKPGRIAVILGGRSREREVSIRSGENVFNALKKRGYDCVKFDLDNDLAKNLVAEKITCAYIILHGKPGEDGSVQGLMELLKIAYTGSGILASALAMDKQLTKKIFKQSGIPTAKHIDINYYDNIKIKLAEAKKMLKFPVMVKPASEGSSFGVVKVDDKNGLETVIFETEKKYRSIIIEEFIKGREVTVGVIGDNDTLEALPVLELIPKNEFYDYEAKYTKGLTEFIVPADFPKKVTQKIKETAKLAHRALGCYAVSRVDMIVKGSDINVLEVNTIPGMTEISDLPAQAKAAGISFDELVGRIVELAYRRPI